MNLKSTILTTIKKILNILPQPVVYWLLKNQKMRQLDLTRIKLIQQKDKGYLSDPKKLTQELLPQLGLNNERIFQFPKELYDFIGQGLYCWQYPIQFSQYLVQLSKLNIQSYLEIGVRHGGTFIITVEYLEKFQFLTKAIGIDICNSKSLLEYQKINPKIEFKRLNSQSAEFKNLISNSPGFDLILIDGDHEEEPVRKDFITVKNKARVIAFHDIVNDACPGVVKVWQEVKEKYKNEYEFFEFVDQYDSCYQKTGEKYLGIGLAVKK